MFVWMKGRRRPKSEVAKVRELIAAGLSDYEIARRTGIARGTILAWRHDGGRASSHPVTLEDRCEACGGVHSPETLDRLAYAYLLGEYLGDGCLWRSRRSGTCVLRISCDAQYRGIIEECCGAIESVRGRAPYVYRVPPSASPRSRPTGVRGLVSFLSTGPGANTVDGSSWSPGSRPSWRNIRSPSFAG